MRVAVAATLALWAGTALLLGEVRRLSRPSLTARLAPYQLRPGVRVAASRPLESFRELLVPLSQAVGERLAAWFGVMEPLPLRLERTHSPLDAAGFRMRQLGHMAAAMALAAFAAVVLRPPPAMALFVVLAAPLLVFLVVEQRVVSASANWQRRLALELPVIAEQLAMLIGAGYSLGAALNRLASRGSGACVTDLQRVLARVQHGLSVPEALREWAAVADTHAVHRLVALLAMHAGTADLSRLVSEEARSQRRDMHRQLVETMERRAQQVWIPVTIATLVPGVIFLAIPFIEALRAFSR